MRAPRTLLRAGDNGLRIVDTRPFRKLILGSHAGLMQWGIYS